MLTVRITSEGRVLVAECSPLDVVAQGEDLPSLFMRLSEQFVIEIHLAGSVEKIPLLPDGLKFNTQSKEPDRG